MSDPEDLRRARRIVILSRSNGSSALLIGFIALVLSAWLGDWLAALASCGMCGGAAMELSGSRLAARRDPRAPGILVGSQIMALVSVLAMAIHLVLIFSPSAAIDWMPGYLHRIVLSDIPFPNDQKAVVGLLFKLAMSLVAFIATFYEGCIALYYASSKRVLRRLTESPPPVLNP